MEKYELCGAKGDIRIVFLSGPATASLLKTLSDKNLILATSFEVQDEFVVLDTQNARLPLYIYTVEIGGVGVCCLIVHPCRGRNAS